MSTRKETKTMTTIKINTVLTSQLVYYKLYRSKSPFDSNDIEKELTRRGSLHMGESTPKTLIGKAQKMFAPRYIWLKDEIEKCETRGSAIENYFFEDDDFYTLISRMLVKVKSMCTTANPEEIAQRLFETLTWSELALFEYIATEASKILEQRQETITSNTWMARMNKEQERKLLDLLYTFSKELLFHTVIDGMEKGPNRSILPSTKNYSSLDIIRYAGGITREQMLLETAYLDETIAALKDTKDNIAANVKAMILKPNRK